MGESYYVRRYRRYKASGMCVVCRREKAREGIVRCGQCNDKMRAAHRDMVANGICFRCGGPIDGGRKDICRACADVHDLKRADARRRNLDNGLCYTCGAKRAAGNRRYCRKHVAKHKAYNRLYRRRIKAAKLSEIRAENSTCPLCNGPKSGGDVCIKCRPLTAGPIRAVAALASGAWSTVYDIARESGLSVRSVYRAIARVNAGDGKIDVRYSGVERGSLAYYRLATPPSWYRP